MDKRIFSRLRIGIEGVFIFQKDDVPPGDFAGHVIDISEGGFKISIDYKQCAESLDNVGEGDVIQYSIADEYTLFGEEKLDIVSGKAKILRKTFENDNVVLGCKFIDRNNELEEYVLNRRTSVYMNNMEKNK